MSIDQSDKKALKQRRLSIMYAVLGGMTLKCAGEIYGISRERVRQIVIKEASTKFPELFKMCLTGRPLSTGSTHYIMQSASIPKMRSLFGTERQQ